VAPYLARALVTRASTAPVTTAEDVAGLDRVARLPWERGGRARDAHSIARSPDHHTYSLLALQQFGAPQRHTKSTAAPPER
jgi:hypothetical protein